MGLLRGAAAGGVPQLLGGDRRVVAGQLVRVLEGAVNRQPLLKAEVLDGPVGLLEVGPLVVDVLRDRQERFGGGVDQVPEVHGHGWRL